MAEIARRFHRYRDLATGIANDQADDLVLQEEELASPGGAAIYIL